MSLLRRKKEEEEKLPHEMRAAKEKSEIEEYIEQSQFETDQLEKLHEASMKRHRNRELHKKRDMPNNHLQEEFEIDIKESYARSLPNCKEQLHLDHLESVLAAGPARFDR